MGTQLLLPKRGTEAAIIRPYLLRPNGWMHQDANWYGGTSQPRGLCVRCLPSPLNFRPMFIIVILISLLAVQVQVLVLYAFYFRKKVQSYSLCFKAYKYWSERELNHWTSLRWKVGWITVKWSRGWQPNQRRYILCNVFEPNRHGYYHLTQNTPLPSNLNLNLNDVD